MVPTSASLVGAGWRSRRRIPHRLRRTASVDAGRSALRRLGDERKLLLVQPKQFGSGAACGHRASRRRLVVDDTYLVPGGSQAGSRLLLPTVPGDRGQRSGGAYDTAPHTRARSGHNRARVARDTEPAHLCLPLNWANCLVPEGATLDRQRKELPLSAREGANGAWRDIALHAHQRVHRYRSSCLHNR